MDAKLLTELRLEGSVRRRRSSAAPQQQQSQTLQRSKLTRQERAIGGATRSKVAAKTQPSVAAVVPSSRQSRKSGNNNNTRSERQRDRERDPPLTLSRVAFGRTCSGRQAGHSMLPPPPPLPAPVRPQQARLRALKQRLDTPRPMAKPMAAAHEQLELLLTRIERGTELDIMPTATPTSTSTSMSAPRRRKLSAARAVRRQMEHPPPVPTVTPLSSARNNYNNRNNSNCEQLQATVATTTTTTTTTTVATTLTNTATTTTAATATATTATATAAYVPLTQNPQLLSPEKRQALLELLSRAEQHDQEIVNILRSEVSDAGDPSRDAMRLTLQMLPLALKPGDSPYCRPFWAGHRYLKERQKLHQQLQPDDIRYKEVKILRAPDGNFFLSKTLEEELKDEKQVLDFIDAELHRSRQTPTQTEMTPGQRARHEKAMEERLELDRQKQQVSECRQRHRLRELKKLENHMTKKTVKKVKKVQEIIELPKPVVYAKKLTVIAEVEKEEEKEENVDDDDDVTPRPTAAQAAMPEELVDLLMQRQQFREQCQRSNLYNTSNCPAPWKLFANIANKLSAELTAKADDELHRSIAGYLKDFVDNETSIDRPTN
ncbi:hypothetical protein ACLKA7_006305 [Drosophila subpalustris]